MRIRLSVNSTIGLIIILCMMGIKSSAQTTKKDKIPEVTLEAFSHGFYRPTLLFKSAPFDSLEILDVETASLFKNRLKFAINWSGYVRLQEQNGELPTQQSSEISMPSGPPTELNIQITTENEGLVAVLQLSEPGESPFYSGRMVFTVLNAEQSADAAAEEILRRMTGMTPPFRSRIACVQKKPNDIKELVSLAYDGNQRWQMTKDNSIALSPSWSPDGRKIVFSSFRHGKDSDLYIADLEAKKIITLLKRQGTDAAPSWSPDGKWIVFAGSSGFSTDLYLIRPDGKDLRNITTSPSIDTSPSWSPTSREIVFMSDRSGTPQVYRMDIDGANLIRLTYDGDYNADPAWSPAGDRIVYVRLENNGFQVRIMDPSGDVDVPLSDEPGDHLEPSWSPDGMKISYSYRGKLWVMNADGTGKQALLADGLMPDWSPLLE